jgi:hypothetical protein
MNRTKTLSSGLLLASLWGLALFITGCATQQPRVTVVTGTTIGLKASSGDGNTQPPQVTFAYKRSELALIPTKGGVAVKKDTPPAGSDAFSTLVAFFFSTEWFGKTEVDSFIATGHAARDIQVRGSEFNTAFAQATLGVVPEEIQMRRAKLIARWRPLGDDQAQRVLDLAQVSVKPAKTSKESLQDAIKDAQTASQLTVLESAFQRVTEEGG